MRKRDPSIVVVGSGFSGAILARKIAEELGYKVLLVERRPHIGGNMYDETDEHGILIQRYGPHFLNTDKYSIIRYLSRYAELFPHDPKLLSYLDGKYVRLPFNFRTVQQLIGPEESEKVLKELREAYRGRDRVPILELAQSDNEIIRAYGELLFEKAYRTYTSKFWGLQPEQIDRSVMSRVPMAMGFDERYLNKDFQYLPKKGFTHLFEHLLDHSNIQIRLNTDALRHLGLDAEKQRITYDGEAVDCLVYTGAVDELFGCRFGTLPYRSLDIRYEYFDSGDVLPCEIVSYPQAEGFTRKTEYRKIMFDDSGAEGSVVATEYPLVYDPSSSDGNIPYYPVLTEKSARLYERYQKEAASFRGLFLCGRLAEFRYYNMDICIEHALSYYETIKDYLLACF